MKQKLTTNIIHIHSKGTGNKKCNVCIQVVLLWLFVQYNL